MYFVYTCNDMKLLCITLDSFNKYYITGMSD